MSQTNKKNAVKDMTDIHTMLYYAIKIKVDRTTRLLSLLNLKLLWTVIIYSRKFEKFFVSF